MHVAPLPPQPLYIGGEWVHTDQILPIELPYDGSPVGSVFLASEETLDRAIRAASQAAPGMAAMSNAERAAVLFRLHELLERDKVEMARTIALETGKPIREARGECDRALLTVFESGIAARQLAGEVVPIDAVSAGKGRMAITVREPVGVVGVITPWNFPLNLAMHKIGPALAAGNTVVHKPSEKTPLSALRLAKLLEEAGLPRGAYNVVTGAAEIGSKLVQDPRVAMITFTGSVEVGRSIRAHAGLKKVTLELGGNSPVIIAPDADLDIAVARVIEGGYANSGQTCISVQRVFVDERRADEFTTRVCDATQKLHIDHPLEESSDVTSLVSEAEAVRVEDWIGEAVDHGSKLLTGGARRRATIAPAVLAELSADTKIATGEVFGPVIAINRHRSIDQAVEQANATSFGLQAGIFTSNLQLAFTLARRLRFGGVMINDIPGFRADPMPYGGVKDSGLGREGPKYAIESMTDLKLICWR